MNISKENNPDAINIITKIIAIIENVADEKIDPSVDSLDHLGLDSLKKLEIMSRIEQDFNISLTEDIASQFTSLSRISRIIARSLENQGAQSTQNQQF